MKNRLSHPRSNGRPRLRFLSSDGFQLSQLYFENTFTGLFSKDHYNHSVYLNSTMMKRSRTTLCLWAMLAFIGPTTTAANDDRYSLGGNNGEDEYDQKTIDGPYRGRRLTQRPGPFGKVLDNAGVPTWGFVPEVRSIYQETDEAKTRALKGGKKGKGGKGGHPVTNYNYGKGKGGYQQESYDYGKGKGGYEQEYYDYGKGKGGYEQEYYDYGKGKGKGGKKGGKGGKGDGNYGKGKGEYYDYGKGKGEYYGKGKGEGGKGT